MSDKKAHFPELESLRGWAILLVLAVHYTGMLRNGNLAIPLDAPFWVKISAAGGTGVTLFFVLSAFLLSRPLFGTQSIDLPRFYRARALRIIPLYYVNVLIALWATGKWVALKALLFIPLGWEVPPYSSPWWSLSTEVQFYLVLPLAMFALRHSVGRVLLALALVGWAATHVYYFHQPGWLMTAGHWEESLFGRGTAFIVGVLAARLHRSPRFEQFSRSRFAPDIAMVVSLTALLVLLRWCSESALLAVIRLPLYHSVEAVAWAAVMLSVLALRSQWRLLFINPVLAFFGKISYSVYLVHSPIMFKLLLPMVMRNEFDWLKVLSSFPIIIAVSVLSYQVIERPFLSLKTAANAQRPQATPPPRAP
jgi:peptidoglycan/LPS O-acetylase OafA/YrhL